MRGAGHAGRGQHEEPAHFSRRHIPPADPHRGGAEAASAFQRDGDTRARPHLSTPRSAARASRSSPVARASRHTQVGIHSALQTRKPSPRAKRRLPQSCTPSERQVLASALDCAPSSEEPRLPAVSVPNSSPPPAPSRRMPSYFLQERASTASARRPLDGQLRHPERPSSRRRAWLSRPSARRRARRPSSRFAGPRGAGAGAGAGPGTAWSSRGTAGGQTERVGCPSVARARPSLRTSPPPEGAAARVAGAVGAGTGSGPLRRSAGRGPGEGRARRADLRCAPAPAREPDLERWAPAGPEGAARRSLPWPRTLLLARGRRPPPPAPPAPSPRPAGRHFRPLTWDALTCLGAPGHQDEGPAGAAEGRESRRPRELAARGLQLRGTGPSLCFPHRG